MSTAREIKRRIRSVKNISQVTGALEAVSASKVRKVQERTLATRAYAGAAFEIMASLGAQSANSMQHPLLQPREEVKEVAVVLITSDRGLAGPYNTNIVRQAIDFENERGLPVRYVTVGRKGRDLMLRRGAQIVADFTDVPDTPNILEITPIARVFMDDFLSGIVDEIHLAYTDFVNTLTQVPVIRRVLPLHATETGLEQVEHTYQEQSGPTAVYSFEPGPEAILDEILPRFTELQLYQAILEAQASEHSARMVAMRNATENALALVDDLTLSYNKARQLAITSEMLDIVGGAEALAQK
jgi:F-type H+-transporting ATPase subunit gamma